MDLKLKLKCLGPGFDRWLFLIFSRQQEEQGENIKVTISTTFLLQVLLQESLLGHGIGLKMNMFMMRMNT